MREIDPGDLLNARLRHEDTPLRDGLEAALRDQAVKHFSNALAGDVKNRRQPMLWQFRSRRQTSLEKRARQSFVDPLLDRRAVDIPHRPSDPRCAQGLTLRRPHRVCTLLSVKCAHFLLRRS